MKVIEKIQSEIKEELKKLISDESRTRLNKWFKMLQEINGGVNIPKKKKAKK